MNNSVKNESLDELQAALRDVDTVLEHLFSLPEEYPFLRDTLSDAEECVEESIEMKDDQLHEIQDQLKDEAARLEEFRYYFRALRDFCRDAHVSLPAFIENGFSRLCEDDYRKAEAASPFSPGLGDDDLLLKWNPQESLEEVLPW